MPTHDGVPRADGNDLINGSNVTRVRVGDTITPHGVVITGVALRRCLLRRAPPEPTSSEIFPRSREGRGI